MSYWEREAELAMGETFAERCKRLETENRQIKAQLAKAREDTARLCAEAYQVVGVLALECGRGEDVLKVLSNLSARKIVYQDVLPFAAREKSEET